MTCAHRPGSATSQTHNPKRGSKRLQAQTRPESSLGALYAGSFSPRNCARRALICYSVCNFVDLVIGAHSLSELDWTTFLRLFREPGLQVTCRVLRDAPLATQ